MIRNLGTLLVLVLVSAISHAQETAYCTITSIRAVQLSNGVQITVRADGVLDIDERRSGSNTKAIVRFQNAKSQVGKSFIDVSKYPVSYLQLSMLPNAKQGVGLDLTVSMYEAAEVNIERSNDQQSVIITVNSRRTIVKRPTNGQNGTVAPAENMTVILEDGMVSVFAVKAKLAALLAELGRRTGSNLVVDDSVREREVSLSLDNLTIDEAFKGIAGASGLAMSVIDGTYMVSDGAPSDLATYHLSSTESFRMKYTRAQAATQLLPTFLYSFLHVNEAQNAVVVTAPPQMLDKIRADFRKIDVPPSQIMIEALAVEVLSTADADSAFGFSLTGKKIQLSSDSTLGDINYSSIGLLPSSFTSRLGALIASGKAKVRANPRIAAVNGQDADIFVGETKFIKVQYTSGGYQQDRIQGVDIGVKLSMTSWTGGNGEITVQLAPQVSNISELERETGLPVLSSRTASTTVRVKDGETIVIGGLSQKQDYKTRSKVPLLGDIPLLGQFFRRTKANTIQSELLIFVTPHILTENGRLQDSSKEDAVRARFQ